MPRVPRAGRCLAAVIGIVAYAFCLGANPAVAREQQAGTAESPARVALHAVDVAGLALILDFGDKEVVIDGGDRPDALADYLAATGIVDPPIELMILSHAHADHYRGFPKVLDTYRVEEIWDTGFDYDAMMYRSLLARMQALPDTRLIRPLAQTHVPAVESGAPQPFQIPSLPEMTFTVLSADHAVALRGPQHVNETSIVVKVEVAGTSFLFTGDAPGGNSSLLEQSAPGLVEGALVGLLARHPDALRADVLVAPFHGSSSAGTSVFIDAVAPRVVIFGANGRFGQPLRSTVARYAKPWRQVFETSQDASRSRNILIELIDTGTLQGQYRAWQDTRVAWQGQLASGLHITQDALDEYCGDSEDRFRARVGRRESVFDPLLLKGADLTGARLQSCVLDEIDLSGTRLAGSDLRGISAIGAKMADADLSHALLKGAKLSESLTRAKLTGVWWPGAPLARADLNGADLSYANLQGGDFTEASLSNAVLDGAHMRQSTLIGTGLEAVHLRRTDLAGSIFEPPPGQTPPITDLIVAPYLATLRFKDSPHALVALREAFQAAGLRQQERAITFSIEHERRLQTAEPERSLKYWFLELPTGYGLAPNRPLLIVLAMVVLCAIGYYLTIEMGQRAGVIVIVRTRQKDRPEDYKVRLCRLRVGRRLPQGLHVSRWHAARTAFALSSINALNLKVQWLDAGSWLRMLRRKNYDLEAVGFGRSLSGLQSLVSMYMMTLWLLMYFGNPFE